MTKRDDETKVTISSGGKSVDTTTGEMRRGADALAIPVLPSFEGRHPDGQTLKIGGSHELDAALWDAHHLDGTVYAVIAFRVQKVGHELDKDGNVTRVETLNGARLALLDDEEGEKLLHEKLAEAGVALL
jgi:hypothetical protein